MDASLQAQLDSISRIREASSVNTNVVKAATRNLIDNTVTKSNALSRAYYRYSLNEKRIMEAIISRIHPMRNDNDLQHIELSADDFAKAYKMEKKSAYKALKRSTNGLQTKLISSTEGKYPIDDSLVIRAKYMEDKGAIVCTLNPLLVPHLMNMTGLFNSYLLANAANFKSSYTWRIYELLISKKFSKEKTGGRFGGSFNIDTSDLRKTLGVPDTYNQGRFKRSVLEYVTLELLEKANIILSLEPVKTSRTITSYKVTFVENENLSIFSDKEAAQLKKTA